MSDGLTRWYLGIDPGVSGGLALANNKGEMQAWKMPETDRDLWDLLKSVRDRHAGDGQGQCLFAIIERVSAGGTSNKEGRRMGASGAFTFGKNYGLLIGMLAASGIPYDYVEPAKWQAEFGLKRRPDESQKAKKNRHKAKAQQLHPSLKVTHAIADASLIADYCCRIKQGLLERPQSQQASVRRDIKRRKQVKKKAAQIPPEATKRVKKKVKKKVKIRRIRRRKGAIASAFSE